MKAKKQFFSIIYIIFISLSLFGLGRIVSIPLEPAFDATGFTENCASEQFIQLGLLYSGSEPGDLVWEDSLKKYRALELKLSNMNSADMTDEEKGKMVLQVLYEEVLFEYEERQSSIYVALLEGKYNCVSASVLYFAAARSLGLEVRGQRTPEHAFCTLYVNDGNGIKAIDVETTNPKGFNPGNKEILESTENYTRYYYVPKKKYNNRREISNLCFVGLVGGNRCSDFINQNNYIQAVPLAIARYLSVNQEHSEMAAEVRRDMDIVCCNFCDYMGFPNQVTYGLPWLVEYAETYGLTEYVQKNLDILVYNAVINCTNDGNAKKANEYLFKYRTYISEKQFAELDNIIFETEMTDYFNKEEPEIFVQYCENYRLQHPELSAGKTKLLNMFQENGWIKILNNYGNNQDFLGGWYKSQEALKQIPGSATLRKQQQNFMSNAVIVIHNDFADLANNRRYEEAEEMLEYGLSLFPNNSTLKADKNKLNKVLKR